MLPWGVSGANCHGARRGVDVYDTTILSIFERITTYDLQRSGTDLDCLHIDREAMVNKRQLETINRLAVNESN